MNRTFRQRGSALIYTLITLTVLSLLLSVVYERVIALMRSSRDWMWKEKALVGVENGSAAAEACLLAYPLWASAEGNSPPFNFRMDDVDIAVRTQRFRVPDVVWIFSESNYKRERRETVRPVIIIDPTIFALMARKDLKLGSGSIITGSIYGPKIRMEDGAEVVGSIISSGGVDIAKRQAEAMVFDSAMSPPTPPSLDLKTAVKPWARSIGDIDLSDTSLSAGYYLKKGDMKIGDATETNVSIWVSGNLTLTGKSILKMELSSDTPIFVVEKDLTGTLSGAKIQGVIYVHGKVSLKGEGLITGALIADEIELSDGVVVQSYDAVPGEKRPASSFWKRKIQTIRN